MNVKTFSSQDNFTTGATLSKLIEKCNNELDIDKKVQLFQSINSILPSQYKISAPSLITDDYIDTAIYRIQQRMQNEIHAL
jgi:hypothetical protein